LERVEGVQRLIVVARAQGEDANDKRLFAYYTERPGARVDPAALRVIAAAKLPEHMRPQAAIRLAAFELTATGKIDRKKLPLPNIEPGGPAKAEDPITDQLQRIWREVLGVGDLDVRQSFFDLGGNSLTGARLFARIDEAFGVRLPLACLFDAPTIQAQADLLVRRGAGGTFSPLVRIASGDPGRCAFFCVHGAGGNVVFLQPLAAHLGKHRPLIGIQAYGVDASTEPLSDIKDIAARYVEAVRQVQPNGPYLLGGYSGGGAIAIEMAHQLRAAGETTGLVALFDALAPGSRLTGFSLAERIAHLPKVSPTIILSFVLRRLMPFVAKPVAATALERAAERTLAAILSGLDSYRPAPYDGDALLVRAEQARLSYVVAGALLGWEQTLRGNVETLTVNATHDDMFEGEALQMLGECLRARLDGLDPG
jgi:thioesterase domain-containing protein/acyl carrier protein